MTLLHRKNRHLGIDISPSAIKLIELSRRGERFQVEAIAVEPLPGDSMENRNPTNLDEIGAAIKRALKASGTVLKTAAAAVPTSSVITRTIPMPTEFGDGEIEANIQIEAAHYIPFPLEEIYLDFQIRGTPTRSSDTQDVLLVASHRENVDLREEALKEAGLKTVIVDVEAYALENTMRIIRDSLINSHGGGPAWPEGEHQIALVDIGGSFTTLYVFQGDMLIFTREQTFGGDRLTMTIADTYALPKAHAELAKRSGELSEDYPATILAPYKQSTAEQIGNALQFFFSSSHYNSVDAIILVGGGAMVAGLDNVVKELLGIPTFIGNPFEHMGSASRVNRRSLLRDAPLYAVACGLALRSFD